MPFHFFDFTSPSEKQQVEVNYIKMQAEAPASPLAPATAAAQPQPPPTAAAAGPQPPAAAAATVAAALSAATLYPQPQYQYPPGLLPPACFWPPRDALVSFFQLFNNEQLEYEVEVERQRRVCPTKAQKTLPSGFSLPRMNANSKP